MSEPELIVFRGPTSQTGIAVREEFSGIDSKWKSEQLWKNKSFEDIKKTLVQEDSLAVLPMWNSHKGEIHLSRALEMIFEEQVKLYTLWPAMIRFQCLTRAEEKNAIKKVISVSVAEAQCSNFLQALGAKFLARPSTVQAYDEFRRDSSIDAVLCAPGQNQDGFNVLFENVANSMNFTTFSLSGCIGSADWSPECWGSLYEKLTPKIAVYFGVQMPIRRVAFSEDQKALFEQLTDDAASIDEIPKILFVTRRTPDQCGLLIEANRKVLPDDILSEVGYSTEITVLQDIGETHSRYTEKAHEFLKKECSSEINHDFLRHKSIENETCFFACPPLGILIHGFEGEIVEPVMRLIVDKYFELYANGIACSEPQRAFFKKYLKAYFKDGMNFINFIDVGL